jgi:hypothetical protein
MSSHRGDFSVIAPDVIVVGDRKLTISLLPAKALLKVHKIIVKMIPAVQYDNPVFQSHIRVIHSLNEIYPAEPTVEDIELFRSHIVKFVGVWYESTKNIRNYANLASLTAMTDSSSNSGTVRPEISQAGTADKFVKISDNGNLSLLDNCESADPDAAKNLDQLKQRVKILKEKLAQCTIDPLCAPKDMTATSVTELTTALEGIENADILK